MGQITSVLIGAGDRGNAYANYAVNHADEVRFIAVAEPDAKKRERFGNRHGIDADMRFSSWEELLAKPRLADSALICTMDRLHYKPTIKALELGYHILLEKPMSQDPAECFRIAECTRKYDRKLLVCHVLRYTAFFSMLKGCWMKAGSGGFYPYSTMKMSHTGITPTAL